MPIATRTRSHIYCNARFYTGVPGLAPIVLWAADGRIRALGGPELLDATPAGPPASTCKVALRCPASTSATCTCSMSGVGWVRLIVTAHRKDVLRTPLPP